MDHTEEHKRGNGSEGKTETRRRITSITLILLTGHLLLRFNLLIALGPIGIPIM
jgi:hypothetical protein